MICVDSSWGAARLTQTHIAGRHYTEAELQAKVTVAAKQAAEETQIAMVWTVRLLPPRPAFVWPLLLSLEMLR